MNRGFVDLLLGLGLPSTLGDFLSCRKRFQSLTNILQLVKLLKNDSGLSGTPGNF